MIRARALVLAAALAASAAWAAAAQADRGAADPAAAGAVADSTRYNVAITDNNLLGVTLTNYGFVGNNFFNRTPSFVYPLGSPYEHLVRGGLWVGALASDTAGAFLGVTTGAVDALAGSSAASGTEFTPAGIAIRERSTFQKGRLGKFYDPDAVSEEDFISLFSDEPGRDINGVRHRALNILVRQENYSWSFSDLQHFLIFHYTITNQGPPLRNVWLGWFSEFASGNKNAYSCWPPLTSCSGQGTWYLKKWVAWDDSLRLFREHYCATQPMPSNCNLAYTPYSVGIKLLGVKPGNVSDTTDKRITVYCVNFQPRAQPPDSDRYVLMSSGKVSDLSDPTVLPTTGDPTEMIAVGPFQVIDPGDSIHVDWALVGGSDAEDAGHYIGYSIQKHAKVAQRAYDYNYIVPVPPPPPAFHAVARHEAIDLYWDDSSESTVDPTSTNPHDFEGYRIYIGEGRLEEDQHRIAQFDIPDTTGFNTGLQAVRLDSAVTFPGDTTRYRYKFTIRGLRDGFKYFCTVTSFDTGTPEVEPLESGKSQNMTMVIPARSAEELAADPHKITVFPNPYRVEARWDQGRLVRDHYLWFGNLPERCSIKIYTLSGDLVFSTDFDGSRYRGEGARGVYNPQTDVDIPPPTMSGGLFAWDLITRQGQAAATGLYLYSIEDKSNGHRTIGKFLIVKSDRES